MKVLFIEWPGYGNKDMLDSYARLGHQVVVFPLSTKECRSDPAYEDSLTAKIHETNPDYIFTFNHYPLISKVCNREDIPYISWVYDSPFVPLYSYTTIFPCNYIFIFDKEFCHEFQKNGISTIFPWRQIQPAWMP